MSDIRFIHRPFASLSLRELHDILWLRNEVFVFGQKITAEPEVDGLDPECVHVLGVMQDARVVATARFFPEKDPIKIGRIAVHQDLQRSGVGTELMKYVREIIGDRPSEMSAQLYLKDWYHSLGWVPRGEVYEEAEIPHIHMVRLPEMTREA